jgi:hypothetical protein
MTALLLGVVFAVAAAVADCPSATDVSPAIACAANSTAAVSSKSSDARRAANGNQRDAEASARTPSEDEPWTYEADPDNDAQRVCLTRGAGGICIESDD